jgi:hypothetical protein
LVRIFYQPCLIDMPSLVEIPFLIWGSFGDFCVCIQTQSNLVIIIIIIIILSFFREQFVRHISRRCLDQTLWNLVGISYAMYQNSVMWMHVSSLPTNSSLQNTPRYQLFIEIGDH